MGPPTRVGWGTAGPRRLGDAGPRRLWDPPPASVEAVDAGHVGVEVAWTVIPFLIVIAMALPATVVTPTPASAVTGGWKILHYAMAVIFLLGGLWAFAAALPRSR